MRYWCCHLSGLVEWHGHWDAWDEDDATGVDVVVIQTPEDDAADLEDVERIQHLEQATAVVLIIQISSKLIKIT